MKNDDTQKRYERKGWKFTFMSNPHEIKLHAKKGNITLRCTSLTDAFRQIKNY